MRKLTFNINNIFFYFKKSFIIYSILYIFSVIVGILLNHDNYESIHEVDLTFWNIFIQNLRLSLILIATGLFSFGIVSGLILIFNGIVLGYVLITIYNTYSLLPIVTGIAPHFFFEIIALILACCISRESYKLFYNFRNIPMKEIRIRYSFYSLLLILSLLLIASIIEASLTLYF